MIKSIILRCLHISRSIINQSIKKTKLIPRKWKWNSDSSWHFLSDPIFSCVIHSIRNGAFSQDKRLIIWLISSTIQITIEKLSNSVKMKWIDCQWYLCDFYPFLWKVKQKKWIIFEGFSDKQKNVWDPFIIDLVSLIRSVLIIIDPTILTFHYYWIPVNFIGSYFAF
jgi:hypothetical protein